MVLGNVMVDLYQKIKVWGQGQIMYFLVNASPPKPSHLATSNFAGAMVIRRGATFCVTLTI